MSDHKRCGLVAKNLYNVCEELVQDRERIENRIERATHLDPTMKNMLRELGIESPLLETSAKASGGQWIDHGQVNDRFSAGDTAP